MKQNVNTHISVISDVWLLLPTKMKKRMIELVCLQNVLASFLYFSFYVSLVCLTIDSYSVKSKNNRNRRFFSLNFRCDEKLGEENEKGYDVTYISTF